MGMTKESMADFIQARLGALMAQGHAQIEGEAGDVEGQGRRYLEAWCQGIIDEIVANAEIETTAGAPDAEHTGHVSA